MEVRKIVVAPASQLVTYSLVLSAEAAMKLRKRTPLLAPQAASLAAIAGSTRSTKRPRSNRPVQAVRVRIFAPSDRKWALRAKWAPLV